VDTISRNAKIRKIAHARSAEGYIVQSLYNAQLLNIRETKFLVEMHRHEIKFAGNEIGDTRA